MVEESPSREKEAESPKPEVQKKSNESASTVSLKDEKIAALEAQLNALSTRFENLTKLINTLASQPQPNPAQPQVLSAPTGGNPLVEMLISKAVGGGEPSVLEKLAMKSLETDIKLKDTIIGSILRKGIKSGDLFHEPSE